MVARKTFLSKSQENKGYGFALDTIIIGQDDLKMLQL